MPGRGTIRANAHRIHDWFDATFDPNADGILRIWRYQADADLRFY
jgi:hypothetical protein